MRFGTGVTDLLQPLPPIVARVLVRTASTSEAGVRGERTGSRYVKIDQRRYCRRRVCRGVAISPELVRLEVARDLAVIRNSVEQLANKLEDLAAKQDQMSQNIVSLQAVEQDITQERSSPPLSGPVSPPARKKARRVAARKLAAQPSSVPPPAFLPQ
jgi:hypothetical protein